jgi:heme/copper-type cytochrome/quinol oxidase subunit 4
VTPSTDAGGGPGPRADLGVVLVAVFALTLVSMLGAEAGVLEGSVRSVVIVAICGVKLHLVGMRFMELRHAPPPLRLAYQTWVVVVGTLIVIVPQLTGTPG